MRSIKSIVAAAAITMGVPAVANAQWYVGADAGVNFHQDADVNSPTALYNGSVDYKLGYVGLAQVGYNFGGPKAEFETGYRRNNIDDITGAVNGNGHEAALSFMLNGIYEFMPQSSWHPFLGAGVGVARVSVDAKAANSNVVVDDQSWEFAYQGIAGVAYDLNSNWALKAQYRYFATLDPDFKASNGSKVDSEHQSHSLLVGFTYKFAKPTPAPVAAPVAAPAPAPAPAPVAKPAAAVQKNFLVFFDFNKADVTPEAQKIITQAASAAKQGGSSRVTLTGHTDRSGSDKYNMALSLKRGNAVKDALIAQGIPADQIVVIGKGESAPLVQTPDGVREPQNRRVEIVLP